MKTDFHHGMFPCKPSKTPHQNAGTASSKYRPNRFTTNLLSDKNETDMNSDGRNMSSAGTGLNKAFTRGQVLQYIEP